MMAAMLVFVWGASYFMARAIRREAAVARLQSDFVAAVSHEFRSPLTTVRQMAEMLECRSRADRRAASPVLPDARRRSRAAAAAGRDAAQLRPDGSRRRAATGSPISTRRRWCARSSMTSSRRRAQAGKAIEIDGA